MGNSAGKLNKALTLLIEVKSTSYVVLSGDCPIGCASEPLDTKT